jgi:hypothetical protein
MTFKIPNAHLFHCRISDERTIRKCNKACSIGPFNAMKLTENLKDAKHYNVIIYIN